MLGIILLIVIGQQFYKLASNYNKKNTWLYPIIGIATYYAGAILVGGLIMFVLFEFFMNSSIEDYSDIGLSLLLMPFGILCTYILYSIFKKKWKKEFSIVKEEIDDIGKDQDLIT